VAGGVVWLVGSVASDAPASGCAVEAIDPDSLHRQLYPVPGCGPDVVGDSRYLYLTAVAYLPGSNDEQIRIERFDTVTRRAVTWAPVDLTVTGSESAHTAMALGGGSLWLWGDGTDGTEVTDGIARDQVVQISSSSGAVQRRFTSALPEIGGAQPSMVWADGALWLAGGPGGSPSVVRITAGTEPAVAFTGTADQSALWLSAGAGPVWVEVATAADDRREDMLSLVALGATGQVATIGTPARAVGAGRALWAVGPGGVGCGGSLRLWRIDARTGGESAVVDLAETCPTKSAVAVDAGFVFALVVGPGPSTAMLYRIAA
jgi:hypothetical protein